MNVIFLDFDGVLDTVHYKSLEDIERRIKILADICKEYDCKVVIEASTKDAIDEETLEVVEGSWVNDIFRLFKNYNVECIGRTPNVTIKTGSNSYISMWKEEEIILFLKRHPEIEHYCIIDDDDTKAMHWEKSDLDKVREHLVETIYYSDNPEEEGLLPKHKKEVGIILQKENNINKLIIGGTMKTKNVFEETGKLGNEISRLHKQLDNVNMKILGLMGECPHEIVFKYNDNHPRMLMIDGTYFCPACGKSIRCVKPEQLQESSFKDSRVIPLTNLSLIGTSSLHYTIRNEVYQNMDTYYNANIATEELSSMMEEQVKDQEQRYESPAKSLRRKRKDN